MEKSFISSLPLIASTLGRKYGLKVVISGEQAYTNGQTIYLPVLPCDSSPELVGLARGFIDHEAAHIRETNMEAVKAAHLVPLEKHLWNTIEDWRVENILSQLFPGCRHNFKWLILHMFDREYQAAPLDLDILNWFLLELRSWSVPELAPRVLVFKSRIDLEIPGFTDKFKPIMNRIKTDCPNTEAAISYAKEIVELMKHLMSMDAVNSGDKPQTGSDQSQIIKTLLDKFEDELPGGIGEIAGKILTESEAVGSVNGGLQVARLASRVFEELPLESIVEARNVTLPLKYKLQSRLQASILKRVNPGRRGRLDQKSIHKLFTQNPRVFLKPAPRLGHNTAVHLLIDTSGSMQGVIEQVGLMAYALCRSLSEIDGIKVAASVFPGGKIGSGQGASWDTVAPVLKPGQALHHRFKFKAAGSTPLGEALWWVLQEMQEMQEMSMLKEKRRMVFILTDGDPNCLNNAELAIAEAKSLGFEIYGLGLGRTALPELLPGKYLEIYHLAELPQKLFGLLGQVICRHQ